MLTILIPLPALSLNHSHISLRRGGRIKTKETREYEQNFTNHLLEYSDEMEEFLNRFNPDQHSFSVQYKFFYPLECFFTKKNRLNLSKLPDVDNLVKICQDLIFRKLINDAHVVKLTAYKLPTKHAAHIKIKIRIISLPQCTEDEYQFSSC